MHISPIYIVSAASILLVITRGTSMDVEFDSTADGSEVFTHLLPEITNCCRFSEAWDGVTDHDIILRTNSLPDQIPGHRFKRSGEGPSLSIINPLDVLRQRLLLEMVRRQMRESQKQVVENRKFMKTIGKRGNFYQQPYEVRRSSLLI